MCGIIGKAGVQSVVPQLLNGLKKLEYRGYDSAGIAVLNDGEIHRLRASGRIQSLEDKINEHNPRGVLGIGHTRWATHGNPTEENAHPHIDNSGKFALVHNGIIENAEEIKNTVLANGVSFKSKTDTEVAVQLLGKFYKGDAVSAIVNTCRELEGSYAFGIICRDCPETFFGVAKASPLVAVKGEKGCYIASDLCAVDDNMQEVYRLQGGEICALTANSLTFYSSDGEIIEKHCENVTVDAGEISKNGYEHFMLKEIYEQPRAVESTVSSFVKNGKICFDNLSADESFLKNSLNDVVIVACGSAYHTGLVGKNVIEKICRIPCRVEIASEFRYAKCFVNDKTLAVFVSQSGETADTLAALRLAKKYGAHTLSVVNASGSAIAQESDSVIYTKAGREVAVATTKAYSAQLVSLYALAVYIGEARGSIDSEEAKKYSDELFALPEKIRITLERTADKMKEISAKLHKCSDVFYIGRLSDYATACEGSLKMKEISYINSQAYAAGELKHGTISLVNEGTPVIAVVADKSVYSKTVSNICEVAARGARVIVITDDCENELVPDAEYTIKVPATLGEYQSSLTVLPLQLLGYYSAKLLGRDIDKPKNLAKSVTVE